MLQIKFNNWYYQNKGKYFKDIAGNLWNNWKWQLKNSIKTFDGLSKFIPFIENDKISQYYKNSKFLITPYLLSLIDFNKIHINNNNLKIIDPIARQIVPSKDEFLDKANGNLDPFHEYKSSPVKGCIKRYKDRVLILPANTCAGYCRYCTRKWNWDSDYTFKKPDIADIKKYLKQNPAVREVIISGGDPLLIPMDFLDELIFEIINISTIEVIRIATRIPSFLPQRINSEVTNVLKKYKPLWVITHFNHANEITPITEIAINKLIQCGVSIANQSVLLKGINDNYDSLKNLFCTLESLRIKPYYIFNCDPVKGTSHFKVPVKTGLKLMQRIRKNIGGLSIPLYVIDLPGKGKIPITEQNSSLFES